MDSLTLTLAIIKIGIDPVLTRIGGLALHWYGLMYVVGIAAGMLILVPYAEKVGISRNTTYDFFWPIVIASLVGGRLYYVVQSNFGWYLVHPWKILATWEGGMAFYGAVFLGSLTLYVLCRLRNVPFGRALDAATLLIAAAQPIGRIGNIINGDIIGYASNLPWATEYTNPHNTFVPSHHIAYQPAAAYELLFGLILLAAIWPLRFRFRVPGTLFFLWAVAYSAGQFALFFLRDNSVVLLGLKEAQVTALVVIVVGVPLYLWWRRTYLAQEEVPPNQAEPERAMDEMREASV